MSDLQMQRQILDLRRQVERISTWDSPGAGGGKQYTTFVVAASDTTAAGKAGADYICDGTADEVEINAALAASTTSTYQRVRLLEGTYTLANTITMTAYSWLDGQGDATLLVIPSTKFGVTASNNCMISNLRMDGNNNGLRGVSCTSVSDVSINRVTFEDISSYCVYMSASSEVRVTDCRMIDNFGACYGVRGTSASSKITVSNNYMEGCTGGAWIDVSVNGTAVYATVSGNTAIDCDYGFEIEGSYNVLIGNTVFHSTGTGSQNGIGVYDGDYNTITGNTIQNYPQNLYIQDLNYSTITGNTSNGDQSLESSSNGIYANTCTYCTIANNVCIDNGTIASSGIWLDACDHNIVMGNLCAGNSYSSSTNPAVNASTGISIDGSDYNFVIGNRSRKTSPDSGSNFQTYAIWLDNASANNMIIHNDVRDGGNANTYQDDSGVTTNIIIDPLNLYSASSSNQLTIATGVVIVPGTGFFTLLPQTGTTDDLDTINGGASGTVIYLRNDNATNTITLKNGTGNLDLISGDIALNAVNDVRALVYDAGAGNWLEVS